MTHEEKQIHNTVHAELREFEEFKELVRQMRKAQKRKEFTDSTLDREVMYECRKLTKQREFEVDEYLKKTEICG